MMNEPDLIKTRLDRFEEDCGIFICPDGREARLPISALPELEEGATVHFRLMTSSEVETVRNRTAREILNEILKSDI